MATTLDFDTAVIDANGTEFYGANIPHEVKEEIERQFHLLLMVEDDREKEEDLFLELLSQVDIGDAWDWKLYKSHVDEYGFDFDGAYVDPYLYELEYVRRN